MTHAPATARVQPRMSSMSACRGYGRDVSERGNPTSPEDDEAEAPEAPETATEDNPDVDDE